MRFANSEPADWLMAMVKGVIACWVIGFLLFAVFPGYADAVVENIATCRTLNVTGTQYNLTADVSSNTNCMSVTASGLELDCHGHSITYAVTSDIGVKGVYGAGADNVTIRNCIIQETSGKMNAIGISMTSGSNNWTIVNNTITTDGLTTYGIYISISELNNISNNTIITYHDTDPYAMYLSTVATSTFNGNYLATNGTTALRFSTAYAGWGFANTFSNNFFNGSITTAGNNYWNTTEALGTRIYSPGGDIGGNYYTNSTGNGRSDLDGCVDYDSDYFCDTAYTLAANNIDYLPYVNAYDPPQYETPPTPANNWNSSSNSSFIVNVTLGWDGDACRLEINQTTNTTMQQITDTRYTINYSIAGLSNGNLTFKAWCNMSATGEWGNTTTRYADIYTPPADTTPAIIYNFQPAWATAYASTTTSMSVSFNTNEPTNCSWSVVDDVYSTMAAMTTTNGTVHSQSYGVSAGNTYIVYFRCKDAAGNNNTVSEVANFSVAASGGGGGGGGIIIITNNTVAVKISPSPITPGMWATIKKNSTWKTEATISDLELYNIVIKERVFCDSKDNPCAQDLCNLSYRPIDQPPKPIPEGGLTVAAKSGRNIIVECAVPAYAVDGNTFSATLETVACKEGASDICETYQTRIQYTVGGFGQNLGEDTTLMDVIGYGILAFSVVVVGLVAVDGRRGRRK